jgi:hypothetical protein
MIALKLASAMAPRPSIARGDEPELEESPRPVCGAPRGITSRVVVVTGFLCFFTVAFVVVGGFALGDVVVVVFVAVVVVFVAVVAVVVVVVAVVVVVVAVGADARQVGTVIVLESNVTAPLRARTLPWTVAPVFSVAEVSARIVPTKLLVVPSVAELPTCQKTLHACAPFSSTTRLPEAVIKVEPAWKIKTASALPPPLRVSEPDRAMADADSYTPEVKVDPPRSLGATVKGVRPAASR